jgi:hypothetical protein
MINTLVIRRYLEFRIHPSDSQTFLMCGWYSMMKSCLSECFACLMRMKDKVKVLGLEIWILGSREAQDLRLGAWNFGSWSLGLGKKISTFK